MRKHKRTFLLLTFFLLVRIKVFCAVFVVVSNADAGPGTLRDALTQAAANGSAEKDYITFNLTDVSETGRTITILTRLPDISSNLVIDGTTQPGAVFGVSDAKILLQPDVNYSSTNVFNLVNVDGFELYGLYVRDFTKSFTYTISGKQYSAFSSVLYVEACKNIQLGAPEKGNVFSNNGNIIRTAYISSQTGQPYPTGIENLKFYSNFCGFEPDGKTYRASTTSTIGIDLSNCKSNIEIGGANILQRNIFGNEVYDISQGPNGSDAQLTASITIENNFFNYDINGSPISNNYTNDNVDPNNESYVFLGSSTGSYAFAIINNKIQCPLSTDISTNGSIVFQGNEELPGTLPVDDYFENIGFIATGKVIIGGDQPGQENTIYGTPLSLNGSSIILRRTNIFCYSKGQEIVWSPLILSKYKLPQINIDHINANTISGTADPLSIVDLYWDDDCHDCEPQTYFATVNTDANGNWVYNGPVKTGVIASATLGNFTSLYTSYAILNNYTVTNSSCGLNNGAITGFKFTNTGSYEIEDSNNNIVSINADAKNLAPGQYKILAINGVYCTKTYNVTINDVTPKIDTNNIHIIQPGCNNLGSITDIVLDNSNPDLYNAQWNDQNGKKYPPGLDLTDASPGSYTLTVSYGNQCVVTYGPVVLSLPKITVAAKGTVTNEHCSLHDGAVSATTITGDMPPYSYSWTDAANNLIGSGNAINGLSAGDYTLHVKDSGCSGIDILYTVSEEIGNIPPPSINNIQACSSGAAILMVNKPDGAGIYYLYDTQTSPEPIDKQKSGKFNITVLSDRYYYVSEASGACESDRVKVSVNIGLSSNNIANTFTPNGDGINDYWDLKNIKNYPTALIQVFNRYGQKVFESKGYSQPFDGTYKGQKLPAGVYYYIINLNTNCNLLSGSLTIVR